MFKNINLFKGVIRHKLIRKKKEGLRKKKLILNGILYIKSTFNNVIFTFTNLEGKPLYWYSCGCLKDVRKGERSKYLTIMSAIFNFSKFLRSKSIKRILMMINGAGLLRKTLLKGFRKSGINIVKLFNLTTVPHNGCRPKKYRRV